MHRTENKRQAIADTMAAITDIRKHLLHHDDRDAAYYAGLCGTIRRCLAQIAEPKPSKTPLNKCVVCRSECNEFDRDGECIHEECDDATGGGELDDDELVDLSAFAREFMDASDSAIYNGEVVARG